MDLGNFSVSLTVKDIEASKAFYQKLGFESILGEESEGWQIMRNGDCVIGLFQGMFDKNILTFNPGWNSEAEVIDGFTDVRVLQQQLKAKGIVPLSEADESAAGPASFILEDPDGNAILIDQHV